MDLLEPVIQPYAWGSREAIAELQGRPVPSPGPEAELWMGAHPSAPSGLERSGRHQTLDQVIAADPAAELGAGVAGAFGGRLPFLLKVLAAAKALSIQVHPSRAQAEAGYRCEGARGLAPGGTGRNYADDWPKPEILCALTRFEVLAGMREPADAAALLRALDVPALEPLAATLAAGTGAGSAGTAGTGAGGAAGDARAAVLARILDWPASEAGRLVANVVAACGRVAAAGLATGGPYAASCAAITRIAADHPADLGVVAALLLRYQVLEPGQAVFLPAGGLHAYLRGTGIELLANSDNVVRAGLTGKHIDIPELLKLADPAVEVPALAPRDLGHGIAVYDSPAPEFRLYRVSPAPATAEGTGNTAGGTGNTAGGTEGTAEGAESSADEMVLPGDGPRLVLVTEGALVLRDPAGTALKLGRGESAFLPAGPAVTAAGRAVAFVATVGDHGEGPGR